jgi:hypothetical protein
MRPDRFGLLCDDDRRAYLTLRRQFHAVATRSRSGERLDVFTAGLQSIRAFIEGAGDGD